MRRGRSCPSRLPGAAAGRDHQARRHRRAAQRHQARPAPGRPVLRHALARQPQGRRALRANRFSVTRQLRYSRDETQLALDLGLFINGLPVATFELKNSLTKQTVEDAVEQYKRDRDPKRAALPVRPLHGAFRRRRPGGAVLHRSSRGKESWFLPFNKGWNDGAGNPPNPDGMKTDYLWKRDPDAAGLTEHPRELRPDRRRRRTARPARRRSTRSSRATTSSMSCASCSPMPASTASGSAT